MRLREMAIIIGACFGLIGTVSADTINVAQDGSGDCLTIADGIGLAEPGDEISIAAGTYYESGLVVTESISLRSTSGERDVLIDAQQQGRCLLVSAVEGDGVSISGITFANGLIGSGGGVNGAAVKITSCSGIISNCGFSGNSGGDYAGALNIDAHDEGESVSVTDCEFENNQSYRGGAIAVGFAVATIERCIFQTNTASYQGGAIHLNNASADVIDCQISSCQATSNHGGGYYAFKSSGVLQGTSISNSSCGIYGGGVYLQESSPSISGCQINDNYSSDCGGGISIGYQSSPIITNCQFNDNECNPGGGGGVWIMYTSTPSFENCEIKGNYVPADQGGGVYLTGSSTGTFTSCLITENIALEGSGGGIIANSSANAQLLDTTVCANQSGQISGSWTDLGGNTVAAECPLIDTDDDGVSDVSDNCDLYNPDQADCNGNGIGDVCDLADGTAQDCNGNGIPDSCDLNDGTAADCNGNSIPDTCDLADGAAEDCDGNGVPDECESLPDCDEDGVPDACEILGGAADANPADGIPDDCQGIVIGACCIQGICVRTTYDDCFSVVGAYAGDGSSCSTAGCPDECPGDINGDGQIGIVDLLTIIDGWGLCP